MLGKLIVTSPENGAQFVFFSNSIAAPNTPATYMREMVEDFIVVVFIAKTRIIVTGNILQFVDACHIGELQENSRQHYHLNS